MKKTAHTSKLFNTVKNYANTCDKFLGEYYQDLDLFSTYKALHNRLNLHRTFDEMNAFIAYNGKKIIEKAPLIPHDVLEALLDTFTDWYLNDEIYEILKEGEDTVSELNELKYYVGVDSITIHSIKTCLQQDDYLDYEGNEFLKRLVYKKNILNDKDFIQLVYRNTESGMSPRSAEDLIEYFYTIVEDCLYPNYLFIDEADVREVIFQLAFELTHKTGFFSLRDKYTIIRGRTNKKRCFSLINNYSEIDGIIPLPSESTSKYFKGIFQNVDLRLFETNYQESQIDLREALRKHFISYDIFKVERASRINSGRGMQKIVLSNLLKSKNSL